MRNTRLDELQVGLKIGRRNINNLRYADDATLMAQSEKELKSLLMRVKEDSETASLKLNIKNKKKLRRRRWWRSKMGRLPASSKICQRFIKIWNDSYKTTSRRQ